MNWPWLYVTWQWYQLICTIYITLLWPDFSLNKEWYGTACKSDHPLYQRSAEVFNQKMSSCMCSLWLNRNIMEPGRQFTRSCCKKLPRITVWWLASKVIASRSTSTVFCPKIFGSWSGTPFVIVFPTENFGSLLTGFDLLLWQKNGSEDPATHGPYMVPHHMLPTSSCPTANHDVDDYN